MLATGDEVVHVRTAYATQSADPANDRAQLAALDDAQKPLVSLLCLRVGGTRSVIVHDPVLDFTFSPESL